MRAAMNAGSHEYRQVHQDFLFLRLSLHNDHFIKPWPPWSHPVPAWRGTQVVGVARRRPASGCRLTSEGVCR